MTSLHKANDKSSIKSSKPVEKMLLNIDDIPVSTNSSKIRISGNIMNIDSVAFFINDTKVKEIYPKDDLFDEVVGPLRVGENIIVIKGKNNSVDKEISSDKKQINYNNEGPKIIVNKPQDGEGLDKEEITVEGKVEGNVDIFKINNHPVIITQEGEFRYTLQLKKGENKIHFIAIDTAGNETATSITVSYNPD